MKYVHTETPEVVTQHAVDALSSHIHAGEQVLWLLSGGSAIELQIRIARALQTRDVTNLTIGLIDERYGPPGHKDENYQQLINADFPFPISRVLSGDTPEKTTEKFAKFITQALDTADFSFGIFGIGADGHTAGIKPHSAAVASTEAVVNYEWDDYHRITVTPATIIKLDEAIIYACGSEKISILQSLVHTEVPVFDQPAQVLKELKVSTLYTDYKLKGAK